MKSPLVIRWEGQEKRIEAIVTAIYESRDWTQYLLSSSQHEYGDLPYSASSAIIILDGDVGPRDLRGICLRDKDLSNSRVLSETDFSGSTIERVSFKNCPLNGTQFYSCRMDKVQFDNCSLKAVNFGSARIKDTDFSSATLDKSCFKNATLVNPTLTGASAQGLEFNYEPWYGIFMNITGKASGTHISYSNPDNLIDLSGEDRMDWSTLEFLREQERICLIEEQGRSFALVLYMLTNYGRSFLRLLLWIIVLWGAFGIVYSAYTMPKWIENIDYLSQTLSWLRPEFLWQCKDGLSQPWYEPYYFSVCTSLTLSLGDVRPINAAAKVFSVMEATIGVIMLGMFVSMLINYRGRSSK